MTNDLSNNNNIMSTNQKMRAVQLSLLIVLFISPVLAKACDICGCGVGSYYLGILPEFNRKIIGLRYRYSYLQSHIGSGGARTYLTTDEYYRTAEVWGGWNIGRNFRLMAYVPVNFNSRHSQEIDNSKTGLGDIGVQGFYRLFDKSGMAGDKIFVHSLWLGAGLKLATGKYEARKPSATSMDPNIFQLGSGSTDFTFNAMYDMRLQDAGISTSVSYKVNTINKSNYRYGNKFSGAAQFYYKFRIKETFTVAPNAGISYESAAQDVDRKFTVDVSGGQALFGTVGLEASFPKVAVGAGFQPVLHQDLANGFIRAGDKFMVHVSLVL
jgi:hypothetical protein